MEALMIPIMWILIIVVVTLVVQVVILYKKLGSDEGGGDCCDQVEKWAPKKDDWVKLAYEHMEIQKKWIMDLRSAVCEHRDFHRSPEPPELGPLSWCKQDPGDPPVPPCTWGTCEE